MSSNIMTRTIIAIAACLGVSMAHAAPTLVVSTNGTLMGATNVSVDGSLYNVRFASGSCNSLFGGCDPASFAFTSSEAAQGAAQALLTMVLIDGAVGAFDSNPGLTNGCGSATSLCWLQIPFQTTIDLFGSPFVYTTITLNAAADNGIFDTTSPAGDNTSNSKTYAVFTATPAVPVAAVPEPATVSLLFFGMGGVLAMGRRRHLGSGRRRPAIDRASLAIRCRAARPA